MSNYHPPIDDMQFLLHDVLGFKNEDLDRDTCEAIFGEAAKLASEVLVPLNAIGDHNGAQLNGDVVSTAPGWQDAYAQYRDGGWNAVPFTEEYGGQGLPYALAFPIQEMWQGANMSFGLCPLLNHGAVEAIHHHGSDEQKDEYLPKLISGEWTGTMNLTEAGAGSDLGLVRTKAEADGNAYKITGQKIFITYGEHDLAENIIHLVLARLPGAPEDVKGISLFIVPKILSNGTRNAVKCIGLEDKLGIHASPTCTMDFDGATGYLVGEAHQGLKYMFTMMNNARLSVGLQGVAIAEASYQHALAYARERTQGKDYASGQRVTIDGHPDVRRMLLTMKSQIEAGRALTYAAALALDAKDAAKVEILTPLVKSWCTDMAVEVASLGVQVHGGMGFVEETGAAQYFRDARILPIYEGTNGIQALDLAFRKTLRDGGQAVKAFIENLRNDGGEALGEYCDALIETTNVLLEAGGQKDLDKVEAMAGPYLRGFALIAGGALLQKSLSMLEGRPDEFSVEKRRTIEFFMANILPHAKAYLQAARHGCSFTTL
ncbi:MAG: acyl-CoA dehydrogenase family protein [Rhodospirillales bacterium]|nr:acyl-CoA dehydrogenase family protein [Rhodospirillales bacterium]